MKHIWNRITLMKYATPENDGKITLDKWLAVLIVAMVAAAAYRVALWIATN